MNITMTLQDFADSFGTSIDELPINLIESCNFTYRILNDKNRDDVLLYVIKRIKSDKQIIASSVRKQEWQDGWNSNLKNNTIIPGYYMKGLPLRLNRNFIMPTDPMFEWNYFRALRTWIFKKYLIECNSFYEFGCGTGHNLYELRLLYPEMELHGFDFVPAACELVNNMGIQGHLFDMTDPDETVKYNEKSVVFTAGSIEQLAGNYEPFLQFILKHKPSMCINIEPVIELFDDTNLMDYLVIDFYRKRGYTEGYLPRLKQLESDGKIEILKIKRTFVGSLMMEGYNIIVWKIL